MTRTAADLSQPSPHAAASAAVTDLSELCEPLFAYVCLLNRSARVGGAHDASEVRAQVKDMLKSMRARAAASGAGLAQQFERIELVLIFFIDYMMKECNLPFSRNWQELAFEANELAGDEKFWDLLDETLRDNSDAAVERLAIFYACIGLGFTGWYAGQPEYLRKKMLEISVRLRGRMEGGDASRICPEAYDDVDKRNLIEPPGAKLVGIAIALAALIVVLFVGNGYLYRRGLSEVDRSLQTVQERLTRERDAQPPSVPAGGAVAPAPGEGEAPR